MSPAPAFSRLRARLTPGLVTPEVFERAVGLLADLYQEE